MSYPVTSNVTHNEDGLWTATVSAAFEDMTTAIEWSESMVETGAIKAQAAVYLTIETKDEQSTDSTENVQQTDSTSE